ncbi:hypothetical protein D3C84_830910 [compost metagenome]
MMTVASRAGIWAWPDPSDTTHSFQKAVGRSRWVIPSSSTPATKAGMDSSRASVRSTRVAPALRVANTSSMLASKLKGANCSIRAPSSR